jgi:hypothetical protein
MQSIMLTDHFGCHRMHLCKPRSIFLNKPEHPVLIHASVFHLLQSSSGYKPYATWAGLKTGELPAIEDIEDGDGDIEWTVQQIAAMKMDWKEPPPGYIARIKAWWAGLAKDRVD